MTTIAVLYMTHPGKEEKYILDFLESIKDIANVDVLSYTGFTAPQTCVERRIEILKGLPDTYKYFMWVDPDDIIVKDVFEDMVQYLQDNPSVDHLYVKEQDVEGPMEYNPDQRSGYCCRAIISTKVAKGQPMKTKKYRYVSDGHFTGICKQFAKNPIRWDEVAYLHRIHEGSLSHQG